MRKGQKIKPQSFHYNLLAKLGEGLHSETYKASKKSPQHDVEHIVALKVLKSALLIEVWKVEFDRLSAVQSTYCVQLLGWEWLMGKPTLVLEYIEGVSLEELFTLKKLSFEEINFICFQIGLGLQDLKRFSVPHGDLNFSNILLTLDGSVKFIDFGLQNKDQTVLYTSPAFCAPEFFVDKEPSYNTDLFALGVLREKLLQGSQIETKNDSSIKVLKSIDKEKRHLFFKDELVKSWNYSERDIRFLQKKINAAYEEGSRVSEKTQSLSKVASSHGFYQPLMYKGWHIRYFRKVQYGALFLFFIVMSNYPVLPPGLFSQVSFSKDFGYAQISVVTHKWHRVKINNLDLGFTPILSLILSSGEHHIVWQSLNGSGSRRLVVDKGQTIILNDEFFE